MDSETKVEMRNCERCGATFEPFVLDAGFARILIGRYCATCEPIAARERQTAEDEERRRSREQLWPQLYPEAFTDTDRKRIPAQAAFDRVAKWQPSEKGMVLFGPTGRGKTRALWELARSLVVVHGKRVQFVKASVLSRSVIESWNTEACIRAAINADVLMIDDLGKEPPMDKSESALLEIIDGRSTTRRPTFISTNYVGQPLVERFRDKQTGEAIVRRIRDFCDPVSFAPVQEKLPI